MKLQTKDLEMEIDGIPILKGINIEVKDKEFVGVIGPNGSGKSTLLKCIYRVLKPTQGCVFLHGRPVDDMSISESAKHMAVVAQHNFHSFDFAVKEVVLMGRSPHKKMMEGDNAEDYAITYECLDKVGMREFAERSFSTLSGGEQQRVILARALAQKTSCLILDEPTNHLDIKYQLQLLDIVKKMQVTVLAAVHDLNIAAMYCDKIVAMQDGKIVGFGAPHELLSSEFIKDMYGVEAKVLRDNCTGQINVMYMPWHLKSSVDSRGNEQGI